MTNIKGERILTVSVEADETYAINYDGVFMVNIINNTDGILTVSETEQYFDDGTAAKCLRLDAGMYFNRLRLQFGTLYITSEKAGDVLISEVF